MLKIIISLILILLSSLSFIFSKSINPAYKYIWLWPTVFSILYILLFIKIDNYKTEIKLTAQFVLFAMFLRFFLYPIILCFSDKSYLGFIHFFVISDEKIYEATLYGAIDLFFSMIYLFFLVSRKSARTKLADKKYFFIGGNKIVYLAYIFFTFLFYIQYGLKYQIINFISFNLEVGYEMLDDVFLILLRQAIIVASALFILLVFDYCRRKYDKTCSLKYLYIALFIGLLNLCIIIGDRRSNQVYVAMLSIFILSDLFPKFKKNITFLFSMIGFFIIAFITLYRVGAVKYGSYFNSVNYIDFSLSNILTQMQIYCGGPVSIASSIIVFENYVKLDISNFIFDFLRSIFGLSFILKKYGYMTTQLYNMYLYSVDQLNGHLVFGTSYGYIFFGVLGIPLITCLNITLASIFNRLFINAKTYETKYLFGFCFLRCMSGIYVNTPSYLATITQYLGSMGLIIIFARMCVLKKSNNNFV